MKLVFLTSFHFTPTNLDSYFFASFRLFSPTFDCGEALDLSCATPFDTFLAGTPASPATFVFLSPLMSYNWEHRRSGYGGSLLFH